LAKASALVLAIDPTQIDPSGELLPRHRRLPPDPYVIHGSFLFDLIRLLEHSQAAGQGLQFDTPLAVVVTKCDLLRDAGLIEWNRLWNTDFRHSGSFCRAAHEDMNGMMAQVLCRLIPEVYNVIRLRFRRHAVFGVSATGCAPMNGKYPHISPWRVEDPLLWLLAEFGLIPTN